jgi:hypothetical protein
MVSAVFLGGWRTSWEWLASALQLGPLLGRRRWVSIGPAPALHSGAECGERQLTSRGHRRWSRLETPHRFSSYLKYNFYRMEYPNLSSFILDFS